MFVVPISSALFVGITVLLLDVVATWFMKAVAMREVQKAMALSSIYDARKNLKWASSIWRTLTGSNIQGSDFSAIHILRRTALLALIMANFGVKGATRQAYGRTKVSKLIYASSETERASVGDDVWRRISGKDGGGFSGRDLLLGSGAMCVGYDGSEIYVAPAFTLSGKNWDDEGFDPEIELKGLSCMSNEEAEENGLNMSFRRRNQEFEHPREDFKMNNMLLSTRNITTGNGSMNLVIDRLVPKQCNELVCLRQMGSCGCTIILQEADEVDLTAFIFFESGTESRELLRTDVAFDYIGDHRGFQDLESMVILWFTPVTLNAQAAYFASRTVQLSDIVISLSSGEKNVTVITAWAAVLYGIWTLIFVSVSIAAVVSYAKLRKCNRGNYVDVTSYEGLIEYLSKTARGDTAGCKSWSSQPSAHFGVHPDHPHVGFKTKLDVGKWREDEIEGLEHN